MRSPGALRGWNTPVRSRAFFVGHPAAGMLRVELRDAGREDRVTATAFLRIAPEGKTIIDAVDHAGPE